MLDRLLVKKHEKLTMSRVGRDYLQVGFYTEVFFRERGVRFIAISNNIDSQNSESGEFAPFLNIMSEWYACVNREMIIFYENLSAHTISISCSP